MTEPTQPGPYTGRPAPPPQPAAPPSDWPTTPPPQGSPYPPTPPAGYAGPPGPPGPPRDPATSSDRLSGSLLILGAALAIGGSFARLHKSEQFVSEDSDEPIYESVASAWSYTTSQRGAEENSITQFFGALLLVAGLAAIAAAVLLLAGHSRRLPLTRVLGVTGATLLFGTVLAVLASALGDAQWDDETRTTTYGAGFYLLLVACLPALGATVTGVLGTRNPAAPALGSAQPWPTPVTAPVPQQYPPPQPASAYQPPPPTS